MHFLSATIGSLQRQTSQSFHVIVAGTDYPELPEPLPSNFEFIGCPDRSSADYKGRQLDGKAKRFAAARRARELGGGYLMFVDSDDLVSRDLVSFVEQDANPNGYLVSDGYVFNAATGQIAPYPFAGFEDYPFDQVCGTCNMMRFSADELPRHEDDNTLFDRVYRLSHPNVRRHAFDEGRPLARIPFRCAVYLKGSENLSGLTPAQHASEFHRGVIEGISEHAVERTVALEEEFDLSAAELKTEPSVI